MNKKTNMTEEEYITGVGVVVAFLAVNFDPTDAIRVLGTVFFNLVRASTIPRTKAIQVFSDTLDLLAEKEEEVDKISEVSKDTN